MRPTATRSLFVFSGIRTMSPSAIDMKCLICIFQLLIRPLG